MENSESKQVAFDSRLDDLASLVDGLRVDLEDRITVQMWKYKGSNVFSPSGLGSGEFCIWIGEPNSTLKIYLSQYDASGNRWITTQESSTTFDYSFGVSIDEPSQGGQYNALIKSIWWNKAMEDGKRVHEVTCEYRHSYRDMVEDKKYVIQVPGYLPIYIPFKKIR